MDGRKQLVQAILKADHEYQQRLERAEDAKRRRDEAVLAATDAGMTRAELAAATGLTRGRIQQIVERARDARRA